MKIKELEMEHPTGQLSMTFRKKESGKTYIAQQHFKLPLQIMTPHYQDDDGTAYVYLLNPSGGVLQHDRLLTEITLEENSKALITTPSSTKFYRMDEGCAKVQNRIAVGKNAVLEYLPEYNAPFAESEAWQDTEIHLDRDSVLIASDMVTAGRISRGEIFKYTRFSTRTRIYVDGKLRIYDNSRMEPGSMDITELGFMEGYLTNGTIYAYAPEMDDHLADRLNQLQHSDNIHFAAGRIDEDLMIIRFLGDNMIDLQDTISAVWGELRKALLGKPAVRIRKY